MSSMDTMTTILTTNCHQIDYQSIDTSKPKRKRQRLDHLSNEEKLMRRKLKNRMAAQSARDRKKVKMQDLEEEVTLLSKQRNALLKQNHSLKARNESLEQQNKELKQRLSAFETKTSIKVETNDTNVWTDSLESAELISAPQPQEQLSAPNRRSLGSTAQTLMTLFVCWLTTKNRMIYSMFSTNILRNYSIQTPMTAVINCRQSMTWSANQYHHQKRHHFWDQLKT